VDIPPYGLDLCLQIQDSLREQHGTNSSSDLVSYGFW